MLANGTQEMHDHHGQELTLELIDARTATPKLTVPRYEPIPLGVPYNTLPPLSEEEQAVRMGYFRKIAEEHALQNIHWIDRQGKRRRKMVDATTANMVCQAIDQLKPETRAIILHFEPIKLIKTLWGCVK